MSQMDSIKRQVYLDYAKAVGIFLVVWGHTIDPVDERGNLLKTIYEIIYNFHMPLFFVISGMGICYGILSSENFNLKDKIVHLVKRLIFPYAFWCGGYTVLSLLRAALGDGEFLVIIVDRGYATLTGALAPLWFLYTLFMVETAFYSIYLMIKCKNKEKSIFAWGGVMLLLALITLFLEKLSEFIDLANLRALLFYPLRMLFRFFPALFFVIIGYEFVLIMSKSSRQVLRKSNAFITALISGFVFAVLSILTHGNIIMFHRFVLGKGAIFFLLLGTFGSIALITAMMLLPNGITCLGKIGKESMHIMVIHYYPMPILNIVSLVTTKFITDDILIVSAIITILLSYLIAVFLFEPFCKVFTKAWEKMVQE